MALMGRDFHRGLVTGTISHATIHDQTVKWRSSFWETEVVEAAMLRAPVVLIFFIYLWSANVFILDRCGLQYYNVLGIRSGPFSQSLFTAITLTLLYAFTIVLSKDVFELSTESAVMFFYLIVAMYSAVSWFPGSEHRAYFFRIMRSIICPGAVISFPEILVADALTSISKVMKDLGVTLAVYYAHVIQGENAVTYHNYAMLLITFLASIPFAIRARQCQIQLSSAADFSAKLPVALNLIKYCTAFPPILLAAAASLGYFDPLLPPLTAIMATINSSYSFLWDIIMDWGLPTLYATSYSHSPVGGTSMTSSCSYFKPRTIFPFTLHLLVAAANLILRFSWAANRIAGLSSLPPTHLILMVELAEVVRRSIWNIFRIEWEINQVEKSAALKQEDKLRKAPPIAALKR